MNRDDRLNRVDRVDRVVNGVVHVVVVNGDDGFNRLHDGGNGLDDRRNGFHDGGDGDRNLFDDDGLGQLGSGNTRGDDVCEGGLGVREDAEDGHEDERKEGDHGDH